jgi:hypothetical protein
VLACLRLLLHPHQQALLLSAPHVRLQARQLLRLRLQLQLLQRLLLEGPDQDHKTDLQHQQVFKKCWVVQKV